MKPSIETLGDILYSPSQYVIPVFQRNYRWEEPEWQKLWESVIEIQKPGKVGNHFMGFLVFVPGLPQPGKHNTFHLIDGQQRLASASILLAALRNVARQAGKTDLADEINQFYLVHPLKKGDEHYRLLPKERDHDGYVALMNGDASLTGRMAGALAFFEGKLRDYGDGAADRLRDVFNTVCQRLEFMCATLQGENPYYIFKSLNSIGVPLGQSDLIRNFMFMHTPPDEQDEFDHGLWRPLEERFARPDGSLDEDRFSRFFRDYLMAKPDGAYVQPGETFASFESRYAATGFKPAELAKTLTVSARHYAVISGRQADNSADVTQALAELNQLESSTTYPLLLALFEQRAASTIDAEQLARAVKMLAGFILRRFICGESSRGYGRIFGRAVAKLGADPLKGLEDYLLDRGWPDDGRFEEAFAAFPLYQRGYTREVLVALERDRRHKEPADLKDAEVEHILPQTLNDEWRAALGPDAERIQAEWLHRPGNLTLSAYNPELTNDAFEKKRVYYADSHIDITRELKDYGKWTEAEIRERGQRLATEAGKIWAGPAKPTIDAKHQTADDDDENPTPELSSLRQLQLAFWTEFMQRLQAESRLIKPRKPFPSNWTNFAIGRWDFNLGATVSAGRGYVDVYLGIYGADKAAHYRQLLEQREEIEAEIGGDLVWYELPQKKSSYVSLVLDDCDPSDRSQWPDQQRWMIEKLEAFHRVFGNKLKDIPATRE